MSKDHEAANLYVRKDMRTHLGDLSKIAFGARGKWKKLASKYGLTVDQVLEQMEAIVEYKIERLEHHKKQKTGGRE